MLAEIIKKIADRFAGAANKNTAQRLIAQWVEVRPKHTPTRPHGLYAIVQTDQPHFTREGKQVFRRDKQPPKGTGKLVPVMLKYALRGSRAKVYPYSSTRQNTRFQRWHDRTVAPLLAA